MSISRGSSQWYSGAAASAAVSFLLRRSPFAAPVVAAASFASLIGFYGYQFNAYLTGVKRINRNATTPKPGWYHFAGGVWELSLVACAFNVGKYGWEMRNGFSPRKLMYMAVNAAPLLARATLMIQALVSISRQRTLEGEGNSGSTHHIVTSSNRDHSQFVDPLAVDRKREGTFKFTAQFAWGICKGLGTIAMLAALTYAFRENRALRAVMVLRQAPRR